MGNVSAGLSHLIEFHENMAESQDLDAPLRSEKQSGAAAENRPELGTCDFRKRFLSTLTCGRKAQDTRCDTDDIWTLLQQAYTRGEDGDAGLKISLSSNKRRDAWTPPHVSGWRSNKRGTRRGYGRR